MFEPRFTYLVLPVLKRDGWTEAAVAPESTSWTSWNAQDEESEQVC